MKRRFLFLYLNTGAGHITSAKIVKDSIERKHPDAEIILLNGFSPHDYWYKIVFERGYRTSCNFVPGAYSLIYDFFRVRLFQEFGFATNFITTSRYIQKKIKELEITDVVSFHFALTPPAMKAIRRLGGRIPFTVVASDPFTAPPIWFFMRDAKHIVFSEQAKEVGLRCQVPPENITVMPFLMNKKFEQVPTTEERLLLRQKHGIDPDKPMVLLAGGGEGLPRALEIVTECLKHKNQFGLIVVCGRDAVTKAALDVLAFANPKLGLHVFGFVSFMDELVKICDCAVIKAGPATLLEVLKCKKPVIICKYIYGQEVGNVHFAVQNRVGWFIQKPKDIYEKINHLFTDKEYYQKLTERLEKLEIPSDQTKIADYIYERTV